MEKRKLGVLGHYFDQTDVPLTGVNLAKELVKIYNFFVEISCQKRLSNETRAKYLKIIHD